MDHLLSAAHLQEKFGSKPSAVADGKGTCH
jgi:hypothetical protein